MIFDYYDRMIILDYYKNYPNGGYFNKPLIVSQYEKLKAFKEIKKSIDKIFILILDFIVKEMKIY